MRAGSSILSSGWLGRNLAPALAEVLGEGRVLAHGEDFGDLQVVGYREAGHEDLV